MLRLFVFLGAAAAAAGCSDTCTHPGVKLFEYKAGDTIQDCSAYGPGLSTPATADECKKAILPLLGIKEVSQEVKDRGFTEVDQDWNFDLCVISGGTGFIRGRGGKSKVDALDEDIPLSVCKCSACPPPASSSSTGTGWTLLGIALGAGSAGGAIAYGAAQTP